MTQYSDEVKFDTYEQYLEAWQYLMCTCQGFLYNNNPGEYAITPELSGDEYEDTVTKERLARIVRGY